MGIRYYPMRDDDPNQLTLEEQHAIAIAEKDAVHTRESTEMDVVVDIKVVADVDV